MSEEKPAGRAVEADADIILGEPRLVAVKMFERDYQIMSDQPELVELLAAEINREARRLRDINPTQMGPGRFDWPVQVAFRLALSRYRAQEAYNSMKAQVEDDAEKLADRILASLGPAEIV
jgi:hypothetical protein